ncbi:MAG: hypothetical protein J4431_04100 [Candidatus Aenigmarchaeota archaeon]|nr:hypothetical protein [Candidatus Aenigmarchaeota archaeon]
MPLKEDVKDTLRIFWQMTKEEFDVMDHKLFRIAAGLAGFLVAGALYFLFLRNFVPF